LKRVAPEVEFIPVKSGEDAAAQAADADAVLGFCTPKIIEVGKKLRWVQAGPDGVGPEELKALADRKVVLTSTQRALGPAAAEEAFSLLLGLTRGPWRGPSELNGKTMLVVGLGGTAKQIARRAHAFGMPVRVIDPRPLERLGEQLESADVVVLACPLNAQTHDLIDAAALKKMKKTAYLINVGSSGVLRMKDVEEALEKKRIAGAGLNWETGNRLPLTGQALPHLTGAIISVAPAGHSPEGRERQWRLFRENVRRFAAGERLLCVVEKDGDS
jgi:phosphoglycerate dehydrogenase-like enzyme